ncbi:hypothetical protein [Ornithinimicrobium avium]|uniref:Uncharacterized protein n=1 Tax=Ornithinimicrobium avium TaxID=2283195 RepID=A0A345NLU3_9MICO|nr:hypothetical protein [Ornithinimicrobium avium]AXH96001.1 hypothetical protein DV701_07555 [Ornithinimicrobium avium]
MHDRTQLGQRVDELVVDLMDAIMFAVAVDDPEAPPSSARVAAAVPVAGLPRRKGKIQLIDATGAWRPRGRQERRSWRSRIQDEVAVRLGASSA